MTDSPAAVRERIRAKLALISVALQQADYTATMLDATDDRPYPTLVVSLEPDEKQRPRELNLNLMPLGPGEADATDFLQFFMEFPFEVSEERLPDVQQAATIVNNHLAVGHFGVNAASDVFFRYVLATPLSASPNAALLVELMSFLEYSQQRFADYLEGVCEGEIDVLVLAEVIQAAEADDPLQPSAG